jgi:hypothetical protein
MIAFAIHAKAQSHLLIQLAGGITQSYPISEIRSIRFSTSSLIINRLNATPISFNIADVNQYFFGDATSIAPDLTGNSNSLDIFPNPAVDHLEVIYSSQEKQEISVDLFDATGRPVYQIFKGLPTGKQVVNIPLKVPSGLYLCRLSTMYEFIMKPVIIQ